MTKSIALNFSPSCTLNNSVEVPSKTFRPVLAEKELASNRPLKEKQSRRKRGSVENSYGRERLDVRESIDSDNTKASYLKPTISSVKRASLAKQKSYRNKRQFKTYSLATSNCSEDIKKMNQDKNGRNHGLGTKSRRTSSIQVNFICQLHLNFILDTRKEWKTYK